MLRLPRAQGETGQCDVCKEARSALNGSLQSGSSTVLQHLSILSKLLAARQEEVDRDFGLDFDGIAVQ